MIHHLPASALRVGDVVDIDDVLDTLVDVRFADPEPGRTNLKFRGRAVTVGGADLVKVVSLAAPHAPRRERKP